MRVQATIILDLRAGSLREAGALIDDVLAAARERAGAEVANVELHSPPGSTPVTLPARAVIGEPARAPHSDGR